MTLLWQTRPTTTHSSSYCLAPEAEGVPKSPTEVGDLEGTDSSASCRRLREAEPRVVAVVGLPGAGKSNLANKLLNHPTWDAFEEGDGTFGATVETQRAEWDGMVIIDTPGIPSHDPQTTLANFDAVVDALRREGSLSTLIFLVQQEEVSPAEFRDYTILLRQLNQLACSKLIVCRQMALGRRQNEAEEDRRWVLEYLTSIPRNFQEAFIRAQSGVGLAVLHSKSNHLAARLKLVPELICCQCSAARPPFTNAGRSLPHAKTSGQEVP